MLSIASVVEGHGEVTALPLLIRRILTELSPGNFANIHQPIRKSRDSLLRPTELEKAVELAARRINRDGVIIVVLDSDGELLYSQRTGEFESMRHMESSAVTSFLLQWKPSKPGA